MSRELKNEFSWSKSRDGTFRECLRKYYFQYYGGWGGWLENADPRVRRIYVLKKLQTRQMWAGDHVHRRIQAVLNHFRQSLTPPTAEQAAEATLNEMRDDFKNSRSGLYRENPNKACGLFEHEYKVSLPDSAWKEVADHAALCIRNFYASEVFTKIKSLPPVDWLEIEELSSFVLDGLKVFVQLDFAFRDGNQVMIYDWKTGHSDSSQNDLQLACYILYAVDRWKVPPAQVSAVEFNLSSGKANARSLDEARIGEIKEYIRDSADEMLFPLSDPDTNTAQEESFDFTDDERVCRYCNFVKVCPKWA